jgi:hypothetical protein
LNTCCIGPSGEDNINSEPCAATIESEVRLCRSSIYNCSIWTCLGLALLFADFAIQWQDIRPARQVASKTVPISVSREESPA